MPSAVRRLLKAIVIGALGCLTAVLVACGDTEGLIPRDDASSLNSALDGVAAACSAGRVDDALDAAARFERGVGALRAPTVDRRLIRHLREGADELERLIPATCDGSATGTTTTDTAPAAPAPTVPATPETVPTTPPETPTTPDAGDGTTTPDDTGTGGGTTPPDAGGGGTTSPDGGTPGTGGSGGGSGGGATGGGTGGAGGTPPDVNRGNAGGAVAPGQGGTAP